LQKATVLLELLGHRNIKKNSSSHQTSKRASIRHYTKYSKYCGCEIVVDKFIHLTTFYPFEQFFISLNNLSSIWINFTTIFLGGWLLLQHLVTAVAHNIWGVDVVLFVWQASFTSFYLFDWISLSFRAQMKGTSLLGKKYGTRGPYSQGESGQRQNPDANRRKDKTTSFNFKVKSGTNQSATRENQLIHSSSR
jgi:hypothetical protein